ncbi:MAG: hypothetical protein CMM19_13110 [Rhodospirillaceae bacterium]|nr:hypothetical protein [Rhodospirillaceae bacterium]
MIIFNKHLSSHGHPEPFELPGRINIYQLASMSRGQAEGPGAAKSPETVVVGKRFKILVREDGTTSKCYNLRILPNIVSDLEAGFLSRENDLAKQLIGLKLNCLHFIEKNDFGFDRIYISSLK